MMLDIIPERPGMPDNLNYTPTPEELSFLWSMNFECYMCEFQSRPHAKVPSGYMEVVKIDDVNRPLCTLCASSVKIDRTVNLSPHHGLIIYSKKFSQGTLNNLVRVCHTQILLDMPQAEHADKVMNELRSLTVNEQIYDFFEDGGGLDSMIKALKYTSIDIAMHKQELFKHILYLPNSRPYIQMYEFWAAANPDFFDFGL